MNLVENAKSHLDERRLRRTSEQISLIGCSHPQPLTLDLMPCVHPVITYPERGKCRYLTIVQQVIICVEPCKLLR